MDHTARCNCSFHDTCETYADPLIARRQKGSGGLGCEDQSDYYRSHHCQSFRCKYLAMTLSQWLAPKPKPAGAEG